MNYKESNSSPDLTLMQSSLRAKIKLYKKRAKEFENYLSKRSEEWERFQNEFNSEVNNIFRDIMNFERDNLSEGQENKIHKLKQIFIKRFRKVFMKGVYGPWSLTKPFGYPGDFKIIDDIYQNNPPTTGFERLFDNYFMMSAISVAVRNRKEDFKRLITAFVNNRQEQLVKIMNLASGSCRDVQEILCSNTLLNKNIIFDCYDNEKEAVEYAKQLLFGFPNVKFIQKNILRICAAKNVNLVINKKYDFIYSTGFFDYLNHKIALRLIKNLRELLTFNGVLTISNVRDKYSNPSVHYMEWAGDWSLVYRSDEEFKNIFIEAGFRENELKTQYEQQKIMQYMVATNKGT